MQEIKITELKPHPRNNEFFDDMSGEKWKEFVSSIKSRGVIEPVVITPDKTIVSGHQRVRACKELGITSVMCDVHTYDNEDQVLQDLLETNIRQRGDVGGSAKKVGLRIKELERLYGIRNGGYEINSQPQKSQEDLATDLGMDVRTLQNYKLLSTMIPELEELLDTGIVTKTTALSIIKELSDTEQEQLIASLDTTKKITNREMQDKIRQLEDAKSDYESLERTYRDKVSENQNLRRQLDSLNSDDPTVQYNKKLKDSTMLFCSKVATFIEQVGGYVWIADKINELPELERTGYIKAVNAIRDWANALEYNINNN